MAKSVVIPRMSLIFLRSKSMSSFTILHTIFPLSKLKKSLNFSTTSTPYPLQYEMIISRPANSPSPIKKRLIPNSKPNDTEPEPGSELGFDEWVDKKLEDPNMKMDKGKRKYYNKRSKRMFGGSDSEDEEHKRLKDNELVELKQEVVELRTLHKKEEELYFYDNFAYPWEKDKHYKMVYQLEKKFFPDQCFDKAFLEPGQVNENVKKGKKKDFGGGVDKNLIFMEEGEKGNVKNRKTRSFDGGVDKNVIFMEEGEKGNVKSKKMRNVDGGVDKNLIFFEEEEKGVNDKGATQEDAKVVDVSEKKVEEFFKGLKKGPDKGSGGVGSGEPFLATRSTGLPPKWDSPGGTVVLVNKPKGWTSFTVCGKLRRLTQVKKVGHAGTLDPMATGLLIVCVGKATKIVDSYQGMMKGYSGIFRLGEATSTWDADSPVIQREPWEHIKDEDIKKTAASFAGEIWQVPPMFSAIKVGGEKMYDKARRGESIELAPRRIAIFEFDVKRSLDDRQNVIFRVRCSKGTYVRSLCADFGKALGSCAHLTALRRDSIGEYSADDAWEFPELEEAITKGYL